MEGANKIFLIGTNPTWKFFGGKKIAGSKSVVNSKVVSFEKYSFMEKQ